MKILTEPQVAEKLIKDHGSVKKALLKFYKSNVDLKKARYKRIHNILVKKMMQEAFSE